MNKYLSRKFLMAVAAFLASLGASITGIVTDNKYISTAGLICTVLSAAIYAACEAFVDASKVEPVKKTATKTKTKE